jgi:putative ABC transport system permease protein
MIKFIIKGLLRDKSRSKLQIFIVAMGVFLTVAISGYLKGVTSDMMNETARLKSGHVRITTKAYLEKEKNLPINFSICNYENLVSELKKDFPEFSWTGRTYFRGTILYRNSSENTKQGPFIGLGLELNSNGGDEIKRLNLNKSISKGKLPEVYNEILIGEKFANRIKIKPGDKLKFITQNKDKLSVSKEFVVAGTIKYGVNTMNNALIILNQNEAAKLLELENCCTEILGFLKSGFYDNDICEKTQINFNKKFHDTNNPQSPFMSKMKDDPEFGFYIEYMESFTGLMSLILIIILSVVLWNAGLLSGLRRYNEFGVRLAMGEEKSQIFKTLISEAFVIGIIGSVAGTILGIGVTLILQRYGINITGMMQGGTMIMPDVIRAKYTNELLYIGFIPGVIAMLIGNALSGTMIFRRRISLLLKELEI